METPSEENREQRQDKRGTNERSQRAGSLLSPLCLLVGGERRGGLRFNLLQPARFESA